MDSLIKIIIIQTYELRTPHFDELLLPLLLSSSSPPLLTSQGGIKTREEKE